ncbi:MAG: hypothetical protein QM775_06320 [Pirellulales bacterium]
MSDVDENPFASRYVRPGATPYVFEHGHDVESVIARFETAGRRGQIVGPHGSGKSTLLASIAKMYRERVVEVRLLELHDGQRQLPPDVRPPIKGVLLVDGYEQLGWPAKLRLEWLRRRSKCGLLVTVHKPHRLPTVYSTAVGLKLAQRLAEDRLAASNNPTAISPAEIRAVFEAEHGNLREVFFRLYDLYESRRS